MTVHLSPLLKRTLGLDAATCVALGVAMTLGAPPLADLTGLPVGLLMVAGLILFPVAALIIWIARRTDAPAAMVWLVIGGNAGWALASLVLLASGWVKPTLAGEAFVIVQAIGVIGLTALEYAGLRQGRMAAA